MLQIISFGYVYIAEESLDLVKEAVQIVTAL
jgi:hypothetical protein